MVTANATAAIVLQIAAASVAGWGAWRCMELQRLAKDPRLQALAWFFGLFSLSVLAHAIWEYQIGSIIQNGRGGLGNRTLSGAWRPAGIENVNAWLLVHHLLMAGSLGVAVVAFGKRHPQRTGEVAAAGLFLGFSNFVPLLLGIQAALTLYLAVRAWLNHMDRKSPGALQVAIGFLLFFVGHLLFYVQHRPGAGRSAIGDVIALVGIVLLVQMLPGRR